MFEPTGVRASVSTLSPALPNRASLWVWRVGGADRGFATSRTAAIDVVTRSLLHAEGGRGRVQPLLVADDIDVDDGVADGPGYLTGGPIWDASYRAGSIYWTVDDHLDAPGYTVGAPDWEDDG
jgi:hypothetical protein